MDVDIVTNHEAVFATQAHKDWCAPAGVQMVLAVLGLVNTSEATQNEIAGRVRRWESYDDSHNGDWGPAAMALALKAYGAPGYEIRAFETRSGALAGLGQGDPGDELAGHPAGVAGRPHLGDDRVPRRCRSGDLQERGDEGRLHPGPVVSADLLDLGTVRPARHVPGRGRDETQLPASGSGPRARYPDRDGLYITVAPTIPVEAR